MSAFVPEAIDKSPFVLSEWIIELFRRSRAGKISGQLIFHLKDGEPLNADLASRSVGEKVQKELALTQKTG